MPDRPDRSLTRQAIEYWGDEYRRLRMAERLGITFETFLTLSPSTRRHVHTWLHDSLRDWRDNPRWLTMAGAPLVLDWTSARPEEDVGGGDPVDVTLTLN